MHSFSVRAPPQKQLASPCDGYLALASPLAGGRVIPPPEVVVFIV